MVPRQVGCGGVRLGKWRLIVDWKTGKVRENPFELECQALLLKANHPEIPVIKGEYYWFSEKRPGQRYTLNPEDTYVKLAKKLRKSYSVQLEGPMAQDAEPSCGWCPVKDCEYNTREG